MGVDNSMNTVIGRASNGEEWGENSGCSGQRSERVRLNIEMAGRIKVLA